MHSTCKHCHQPLSQTSQGLWVSPDSVIPQYCWVDEVQGSQLHEPAPAPGDQALPDPSVLLPGSAKFSDHPGYVASSCELREVVVAETRVTNNGFRCAATGGHCLPRQACAGIRAREAARDQLRAELAQAKPSLSQVPVALALPDLATSFVLDTLHNDETTPDQALIDHFHQELGIGYWAAGQLVAKRASVRLGLYKDPELSDDVRRILQQAC